MGLTRKVKRNLDNSSGLPPELRDSINSLFDDFYGKEDDDDEEVDEESDNISWKSDMDEESDNISWKSDKDKESDLPVETDDNND
ncbi:MAG: hypothetical protein DUD27_01040 [Lachnospiraceae bacterium]|uniref:Uncharacterized protein n=1 Tax=Candidatus Weimeria bifida TaxID=2599074 RepID=A0A6N7IYT4_9FIRM|nr:hypothetical protein [Candidatus Weimeria bifida]RRF97176.1 MAG: hypothetical protein DUD27_01040 [Lachnospiraceae bacterium]